ncbi:MAG: hypothetical protein K8S99_14380 [Planctomycetes bacterium]|nr:hypothetical protein [Planctomycetota bacterium]
MAGTENTEATPQITVTPAMQQEVAAARKRRTKIDRAAGVASFNGWCAAILAAISLPFAFFSPTSAVAAAVLATTAFIEFRGRRMLRALDTRAPVLLACNQFAFGAIIVAYAAWNIYLVKHGQGGYADVIAQHPELSDALGPLGAMIQKMEALTYCLLMLGTLLFQGGTGVYYLTRRRYLREYLAETPEWVTQMLRAAA